MTSEDLQAVLPENLALRLRRANSWLERAEQEVNEPDARFIFYWIAFNAIYGKEESSGVRSKERYLFDDLFRTVLSIDRQNRINDAVWKNLADSIRPLLDNQYVYLPFWKHVWGTGGDDWKTTFEQEKWEGLKPATRGNTRAALNIVFDRLYVVRNQVVHGGATWKTGRNREQLRDGVEILALLVPIFIELVESNPEIDWGPPDYSFADETGSIL